jgi:glycerol-3-phosphate acyltransferase PlsY
VALSRYVSLGTVSAAILFVAISFVPAFGTTLYFCGFAAVMALTIVYKHRENIQRLLAGAENKLRF